MAIVRKSGVLISVTFTPISGTTQPTAAYVELQYTDLNGVTQRANIQLTEGMDGAWSAIWDSSVSGPGTVMWVAYGTGALEAAAQGQFEVLANAANTI